jgi:hypothetical protein
MWAVSDHELTGRDQVEGGILIFVPLLLALFLAIARTEQGKLAKLAALIARLPPTGEQITAEDKRRGMIRAEQGRVNQPRFRIAMAALWIILLGGVYYNVYAKYQSVASCHAQLGQLQLLETKYAQTEAQLDASEATLDAAEAQLDRAK